MSSARVRYATLVADTVTTFNLSGAIGAQGGTVRVLTDGADTHRIYVRGDGEDPAVDQDGANCLLGGRQTWRKIRVTPTVAGAASLKLISAGTPWVMVEVIDADAAEDDQAPDADLGALVTAGVAELTTAVTALRATSTALAVDDNDVDDNDVVTLTATVTSTGLGVTPTGTVQFRVDGSPFGDPVALIAGVAELATADLPISPEISVTARYLPAAGSALAESTSAGVAVVVAVETTTALAADDTTIDEGDEVTLTATLDPVAAAGTVQFMDGAAALGDPVAVAAGTAEYATSALTPGDHSITAVFTPTDATAYTTSTSEAVTVEVAEATTTTLAADDTTIDEGDEVTLTATLDPVAAAGTVQFMDGAAALGDPVAVAAGTAEYATAALTEAVHSITAVFIPTDATAYTTSTSAPVTVTVSGA